MQIFGLLAFMEQKENNNNDNVNNNVIVIVFFLLDKGNEAVNLQKECLLLLHYHVPMEDFSETFEFTSSKILWHLVLKCNQTTQG